MSFTPLNQISSFAGVQHTSLNCIICTDNFEQKDVAFAHSGTSIPHAFHLHCIEYWMNTSTTCPTCRLPITHVNGQAVATREAAYAEERTHTWHVRELYASSFRGQLARVTQVLQQGVFTPDELGKALNDATHGGFLNVVQVILARGISQVQRQAAVLKATNINHLEMVQALLASGPISNAVRGEALKNAVRFCNPGIVQALLGSGEISNEDREIVFSSAEQIGHPAIVQAVLTSGVIGQDKREHALEMASERGRLENVRSLLASGEISETSRGRAVVYAASKGHLDIVRDLLNNGPISNANKEQAIQEVIRSRSNQTQNIVALLKGEPSDKEPASRA